MRNYWNFFKSHPRALGFGFSHTFFSSFGQTFFIAFFGTYILSDFNITSTTYGSIYAFATVIGSFSLSYFGEIIDRFSFRVFAIIVSLGLSITTLSFYFVESIVGLCIVLFLLRLFGQGLSPLINDAVMAKVFHKNRGKALAITALGHPIGEALLPIILIQPTLYYLGWRESWLVSGLITLTCFPLASFLLSKNLKGDINYKKTEAGQERVSRLSVLVDKRFYLLIPTAVMNAFVLTAAFFHFSYVMAEKTWTPQLAASGFVIFGLMRALGSLFSGQLIDRYPIFLLLKFYLIPLLIGISSLFLPLNNWGIIVFFFFCGTSAGFSSNLFTAIWAEIFGTQFLGTIRGLATTCMVISTALGPPIIGWMIDGNYSIQAITLFFLVIIILSYALIFFHPKTYFSKS